MAEIKNTFIKSKMNKDLDSRLVPNGEYREAINASVSSSEDADVGALENIISNNFLLEDAVIGKFINLSVIGYCKDEAKDRIFLFLTNYTDGTLDQSGFPTGDRTVIDGKGNTQFVKGSACLIICYSIITQETKIIVEGTFLNFSKFSRITGANVVEDLMFWTDNRNQPRKINVETAIKDPSYYKYEDNISVAKYAPYRPISFLRSNVYPSGVIESSLIDESSEYLAPHISTMFTSWETDSSGDETIAKFDSSITANDIYQNPYIWLVGNEYITNVGYDYNFDETHGANSQYSYFWRVMQVSNRKSGNKYYLRSAKRVNAGSSGYYDELTFALTDFVDTGTPAMTSFETKWEPGDILDISIPNPYHDSNFLNTSRDNSYLRDKFVRFSYRFKYDDNEYSILAPFSQVAFIPKQQSRWLYNDDEDTKRSGVVSFLENSVTYVGLNIPCPDDILQRPGWLDQVELYHKVKEVQIVAKASDDLAVKVIADIPIKDALGLGTARQVQIIEDGTNYDSQASGNGQVLSAQKIGDSNGTFLRVISTPTTPGSGVIDDIQPSPYVSGLNIRKDDEYSLRDPYNPTLATTAKIKVTAVDNYIYYEYRSEKPIKTLPDNVLTRVSDITPMRALAQEAVGGRIMYGNFLQNLTVPETLDFDVSVDEREVVTQLPGDLPDQDSIIPIELPYHSLKQNRTYKVGLVLYDKFGRASNVITSSTAQGCFSSIVNGSDSPADWWGNAIRVTMNELIPEERTSDYVGIYDRIRNPLGWYSYKFVVQQLEQDWYNLYVPGTTSGIFKYETKATSAGEKVNLTYEGENSSAMIAIYGDNINKLPRDLKEAGPQDKVYGSSKRLWNRLYANEYSDNPETQIWGQELNPSAIEVSDIKPFREMGDWTNKRGIDISKLYAPGGIVSGPEQYPYPGSTGKSDPFFRAQENPFIATLGVSKRYGFFTSVPYDSSASGWSPYTGGVQDSGDDNVDKFVFSQKLNVYEVSPDVSAIDIFYETSTTGLIKDLNQAIKADNDPPVQYDVDFFNLAYSEGSSAGSIVSTEFSIIDDNGNYLNQEFAFIELEKVEKVSLDASGSIVGGSSVDITNLEYPIGYPNVSKFNLVQTVVGTANPPASPKYAIRYADISVPRDALGLDFFSSTSSTEEFYIFTFKITDEDGNSSTAKHQGVMTNRQGQIELFQQQSGGQADRIHSPKWLMNFTGEDWTQGRSSNGDYVKRPSLWSTPYDPDNISFWTDSYGAQWERFWGDGKQGYGSSELAFFRYRCWNKWVNEVSNEIRLHSESIKPNSGFFKNTRKSVGMNTGRMYTSFALNQPSIGNSGHPTIIGDSPHITPNMAYIVNSADDPDAPRRTDCQQIRSTTDWVGVGSYQFPDEVMFKQDADLDKCIMLLDDHKNGAWGTKVDGNGVFYQIRRWLLTFGMHDIKGSNQNQFRLTNDNGWEYNNYNSGARTSSTIDTSHVLSSPNSLFEIKRKARWEMFTYLVKDNLLWPKVLVRKPDGSGTQELDIFYTDGTGPDTGKQAYRCWIEMQPSTFQGSTPTEAVGLLKVRAQPIIWYWNGGTGNFERMQQNFPLKYYLHGQNVTYTVGEVRVPISGSNAGGKTWDDMVSFVKWNGGGFTASESFGSGDNQDLGGKWDGSGNIRLNKNVRSGKRGAARLLLEVEAFDAGDFTDPNNPTPGDGSEQLDVVGTTNNMIRAGFVVYDKQKSSCPGSGDS
jgi:hypothetical protein